MHISETSIATSKTQCARRELGLSANSAGSSVFFMKYMCTFFCGFDMTFHHNVRAKTADILSRQMFTALRKDLQTAATCWPTLNKVKMQEIAELGILDQVLAGIEVREESDRKLEIGLSRGLSLVISLVPGTALAPPLDFQRHFALEEVLKRALLTLELKHRSVAHIEDIAAAKKAAEDAAVEEAARASGRPVHVRASIAPVSGNILSALPSISGKIMPCKKSWQRFHELGCYSRGVKRTAFKLVDPIDQVFECGSNLLDLQKHIVNFLLMQHIENIISAAGKFLSALGLKFSVEKTDRGLALIVEGTVFEVYHDWLTLSYVLKYGTSSVSFTAPKEFLHFLVSSVIVLAIR